MHWLSWWSKVWCRLSHTVWTKTFSLNLFVADFTVTFLFIIVFRTETSGECSITGRSHFIFGDLRSFAPSAPKIKRCGCSRQDVVISDAQFLPDGWLLLSLAQTGSSVELRCTSSFWQAKAAVPWVLCTHSFIQHHPAIHCLTNTPDSCLKQPVLSWFRPHERATDSSGYTYGISDTVQNAITVAERSFKWKINKWMSEHIFKKRLQLFLNPIFSRWSPRVCFESRKANRLIQLIRIYEKVDGREARLVLWIDSIKKSQATAICFSFHSPSLRSIWPEQVPAAAQDEGGMQI